MGRRALFARGHADLDALRRIAEEGEQEVAHGGGGGGAEICLEDIAGVGDLRRGGGVDHVLQADVVLRLVVAEGAAVPVGKQLRGEIVPVAGHAQCDAIPGEWRDGDLRAAEREGERLEADLVGRGEGFQPAGLQRGVVGAVGQPQGAFHGDVALGVEQHRLDHVGLLGKAGDGVGELRDVKLADGLDDLDEMWGQGGHGVEVGGGEGGVQATRRGYKAEMSYRF